MLKQSFCWGGPSAMARPYQWSARSYATRSTCQRPIIVASHWPYGLRAVTGAGRASSWNARSRASKPRAICPFSPSFAMPHWTSAWTSMC